MAGNLSGSFESDERVEPALVQPRQARQLVGLSLGGDRGFYLTATVRENLEFFASLRGVRGIRAEVRRVARQVALDDRLNDPFETLSKGLRQRVHIARSLLGSPLLLVLDEPTVGLDVEAARDLRSLVADVAGWGCGVLLTTHLFADVEAVGTHYSVLGGGRVRASGTVAELGRNTTGAANLEDWYLGLVGTK